MTRRPDMHGFSLVELLVVMTLLLIVIVGVLTAFTQMMQVRKRTETLIEAQQNLKIALTTLTNGLQMTGLEMIRDVAFLPDPPCTHPAAHPAFCADPRRVRGTSGIVLMAPMQDRRFLRPRNASGTSCQSPPPPSAACTSTDPCIVGSKIDVCTPSGYPDDAWRDQTVVVCGPVASGTCPPDGWVVPNARLPQAVPLQQPPVCRDPSVSSDLCCVVRRVGSGPTCASGCARPAPPDENGPCTGAGACFESITFTQPLPPFLPTRPQCISIAPVQVLHYQVWELPDPTSIHPVHPGRRRFLMMRRNRELDAGGQPLWIRVASDVEDLQMCYRLDPQCDPSQTCRPWMGGDGDWDGFRCADTGVPPTIRRVHSVVLQVTVSTVIPIPQALQFEAPAGSPCDPQGLPPPPAPPPPIGPNRWRYLTACASAILRNVVYNETVDWF